jgi:2-dehydro-3-deoxygluconokinase
MARVVCFGELLVRLTAPGRELLLQSNRLDVCIGGAEANVAVALASLGHRAAMVSRVPDNPLGEAAVRHLRASGVDVAGVTRAAGRMGLYFVSPASGVRPAAITYDREQSSFAFAHPESYDWDALLQGADLLHLSGITSAVSEGAATAALAAAKAAKAKGVRVSFDGNYRAQLWTKRAGDPRTILTELVAQADVFFGNHRDVALLLEREFSADGEERRREAALAAFEAFPNLQMIASTARHVVDCDHHQLSARVDQRDGSAQTKEVALTGIVDRIGAGDAFAAGVLHGLVSGAGTKAASDYGLALACLKHGLPGDASLFAQADIDAFLAGERDVRR